MAHTHRIARSSQRRLVAVLAPAAHRHLAHRRGTDDQAGALSLAETFQLWHLSDTALRSGRRLRRAARNTGLWHHQIRDGGAVRHFAHSARDGNGRWTVRSVSSSDLPRRIEEGVAWLDRNARNDPLARLLIIPEHYIVAIWFRKKRSDNLLLLEATAGARGLEVGSTYDFDTFRRALIAAPA